MEKKFLEEIETFGYDLEENIYIFEMIKHVGEDYEFLGLEPYEKAEAFRFTITYYENSKKFSISSKQERLTEWIEYLNGVFAKENLTSFFKVLKLCTSSFENIMEKKSEKVDQLEKLKKEKEEKIRLEEEEKKNLEKEKLQKELEEKERKEKERIQKELEEKLKKEQQEKERKEKELKRRKELEEEFAREQEEFWKKKDEEEKIKKQLEERKKQFMEELDEKKDEKITIKDPKMKGYKETKEHIELKKIANEKAEEKKKREEEEKWRKHQEKLKREEEERIRREEEEKREKEEKEKREKQKQILEEEKKKYLENLEKTQKEKGKVCEKCEATYNGHICQSCFYTELVGYKAHDLEASDSSSYQVSSSECDTITLKDLLIRLKKTKVLHHQDALKAYEDYVKNKELPEKTPDRLLKEAIAGVFYNQKSENDQRVLSAFSGGYFSKIQTFNHISKDHTLLGFHDSLIYVCMRALLKKGDHVIITHPGHKSLYTTLTNIGCKISYWKAKKTFNWKFDVSECAKLIESDTKLIIVNFPHHPTGARISKEERLDLIKAANGIPILADESYMLLEESERNQLISIVDDYENAISISGMGKIVQVEGFRSLGWISSRNQSLLLKIKPFIPYSSFKHVLLELVTLLTIKAGDQIINPIINTIKSNIAQSRSLFSKYKCVVEYTRPSSGICSFGELDLSNLLQKKSFDEITKEMKETIDLCMLPATIYDIDTPNHFLIGYGRSDFKRVLIKLGWFLKAKRGEVLKEELNIFNDSTPPEVFHNVCTFLTEKEVLKLCLVSYETNVKINFGEYWQNKYSKLNTQDVFKSYEDYNWKQKYFLLNSTYWGTHYFNITQSGFISIEKKDIEKIDEWSIEFWTFSTSTNPPMITHLPLNYCTLKSNKWTHISIVHQNKKLLIYVNGEKKNTLSSKGMLKFPISFGNDFTQQMNQNYPNYGVLFTGGIADLKIFYYARTEKEINYYKSRKQEITKNSGLICYYPLDTKLYDVVNEEVLAHAFSAESKKLYQQDFENIKMFDEKIVYEDDSDDFEYY